MDAWCEDVEEEDDNDGLDFDKCSHELDVKEEETSCGSCLLKLSAAIVSPCLGDTGMAEL